MSKFDYYDFPCYNGHITIDACNCLCGYKYEYNGIVSNNEKRIYPRRISNYLKWTILKEVKCEECKKIK